MNTINIASSKDTIRKMTKSELSEHKRYLERVQLLIQSDLEYIDKMITKQFDQHLEYIENLHRSAIKKTNDVAKYPFF